MFATSSDILRIYKPQFYQGEYLIQQLCEMKNNNSEYSGPLTSFDWSQHCLNIIATSSIDNTVTIWDIN